MSVGSEHQIAERGHDWARTIALCLGAFFVLVGAGKLLHVYAFRGTVDVLVVEALGRTHLPLPLVSISLTAATTGVEVAIGAWLLLCARSPRFPAAAAGALLAVFTGVLIVMLFLDNPPACGCLGSWDVLRGDAKVVAGFGIARNLGLLTITLWLASGSRGASRPLLVRPGHAAGFTLIEMLVVISIIAVLIALLLPALAAATKQGTKTETLSAHRQSAAAVMQYCDSEKGFLPFLATPGEPELGIFPDGDWGDFGAPSYFKGQSALWPTALLAHGIDLSNLPENYTPTEGPPRLATWLWMTHSAVSRPEYWEGLDPPNSMLLFGGVRLDEATYPSSKGLLGDTGHPEEQPTHWAVSMFDGSAATRSITDPPLGINDLPRRYGAIPWRVFTTPGGVRGRDY